MSDHTFSNVKKVSIRETYSDTTGHSFVCITLYGVEGSETVIRLHRFGGVPIEIERKKSDG